MIENLEGEEWKDFGVVKGVDFTGYYMASNKGRIKSCQRTIKHKNGRRTSVKEKIKSAYIKKDGRCAVSLSKGSKQYSMSVHRLVAIAFIPNPENYPCINHKDENPLNNCVENLEWCTVKYNNNYGTKCDRQAEKVGVPIVQLDKDRNLLKVWRSANVTEMSGYDSATITRCLNKTQQTHHGYRWEYLEDYKKDFPDIDYGKYKNVDIKLFSDDYVSVIDKVPIVQIDPNSHIVKAWNSIAEAGRNGYRLSSIEACLSGAYKTHNNCKWLRISDFEKQYGNIQNYENCSADDPIFDFNLYIKVVQLSLEGKPLRVYNSIKETEQFGFRADGISGCINGLRKTSYGYKWMAYDDFVNTFGVIKINDCNIDFLPKKKQNIRGKIVQLDNDNSIVKVWDRMIDAENFGYRCSGISMCISGKYGTHGGYKWMTLSDYENKFGKIE